LKTKKNLFLYFPFNFSDTGQINVNDADSYTLPSSLDDTIRAKIDRLPFIAQDCLKYAAIIQHNIPLSLILRMFKKGRGDTLETVDESKVRQAMEELVAQNFLELKQPEPQPQYIFKNDLISKVVYEDMTPVAKVKNGAKELLLFLKI